MKRISCRWTVCMLTGVVLLLSGLAAQGWARGGTATPGFIVASVQAEMLEIREAFAARASDLAIEGIAATTTGFSGPPTNAARMKVMTSVVGRIEKEHDAVARRLDKLRDRTLARLEHLGADQNDLDDIVLAHSTARGISGAAEAGAIQDVFQALGEYLALLN